MPPNLIEDYDCIGIDAENTLIQWDRHEVCKLIVEGHLKEL
jgi:hypothetical protein